MNPKFQVGDIVNWDEKYVRAAAAQKYLSMTGPFIVTLVTPWHQTGTFVVSLRRAGDGFEPRHKGMGAPYHGNNWSDQFFTKDLFLTAVHQRGLRRDNSKLETARRVPED